MRTTWSILCITSIMTLTACWSAAWAWQHNGVPVCAVPPVPTFVSRQFDQVMTSDGRGGALVAFADNTGSGTIAILGQHLTRAGLIDTDTPVQSDCGATLYSPGGASPNHLRMCSDGAGGAFVGWEEHGILVGGSSDNIYVQRMDEHDQPVFSTNGVLVCGASGIQMFAPQTYGAMAPDDGGGCYLVWEDPRSGSYDIYLQHITSTGARSAGWPADGLGICTASGDQHSPSLIADGAGGVIVVWADERNNLTTSDDIYVLRVNPDGSLPTGWSANGNVVCNESTGQTRPTLTSDFNGGAFIAWEDGRANLGDIFAQHMLANGQADPRWAAQGNSVTSAAQTQSNPVECSDDSTGFVIAWQDPRTAGMGGSTGSDIYAMRLTVAGAIESGWTTDGTPMCTAADEQSFPQVVSDGTGGVLAVWNDKRTGSALDFDIYAMHLTVHGATPSGWSTNGNALCSAGNNQLHPVLTLGDPHFAIAVWEDARTQSPDPANTDIYAERFASDGVDDTLLAVPPQQAQTGLTLTISPNPVRSSALIELSSSIGPVDVLTVQDVGGRTVRHLAMPTGASSSPQLRVQWNLRAEDGRRVEPGVYWVTGRSGGQSTRKALVVLR